MTTFTEIIKQENNITLNYVAKYRGRNVTVNVYIESNIECYIKEILQVRKKRKIVRNFIQNLIFKNFKKDELVKEQKIRDTINLTYQNYTKSLRNKLIFNKNFLKILVYTLPEFVRIFDNKIDTTNAYSFYDELIKIFQSFNLVDAINFKDSIDIVDLLNLIETHFLVYCLIES